jgi:hypothetical protein
MLLRRNIGDRGFAGVARVGHASAKIQTSDPGDRAL